MESKCAKSAHYGRWKTEKSIRFCPCIKVWESGTCLILMKQCNEETRNFLYSISLKKHPMTLKCLFNFESFSRSRVFFHFGNLFPIPLLSEIKKNAFAILWR